MTRLSGVPPFPLPGPGAVALAYGNSISDLNAYLGQWFTALCNRYGWIRANSNMLGNGNFEDDITLQILNNNIQWTTPSGTLTVDSTRARFGQRSATLTPIGGVPSYTSPFNIPSGDAHGDEHNIPPPRTDPIPTNTIVGLTTYVFSAWLYLPSAATTAPYLALYDRQMGESGYTATIGQAASLALRGTWQQLTVVGTTRAGIVEGFVRVVYPELTNDPNKAIGIDGAMLEVASGAHYQTNPQPSSTTQFFDNATRGAIGGSELQNLVLQADRSNDASHIALYNNGIIEGRAANIAGFQTRVADVAPDIVFVMYSTNDLYRWQSVGNPPTPTT